EAAQEAPGPARPAAQYAVQPISEGGEGTMAQSELEPRGLLAARGAADGVTAVAPVSGGWDTAIWRVERGDTTYALRVFRPQQARIARREAVVMRAGIPGVPIPALHAEGTWRERPALLIGWCAGRNLLDT